jgi:hypothetical protein
LAPKRDLLIDGRQVEIKGDVGCREGVGRHPSHALRQVGEMIFGGVNRPDDVAHRVDEFSG